MVIPSTPALPLLALTRCNAAFRLSRSQTSSISRSVLAGRSDSFVAPDDSVSSLPAPRASPVSGDEKSRRIWTCCCDPSARLMAYWPLLLVRAFSHRFRLGLSVAPPFGCWSASLALPTSWPVGSEEARPRALASVRRSNCTCGFPACSFHEGATTRRGVNEGIRPIKLTSPSSPRRRRTGRVCQPAQRHRR